MFEVSPHSSEHALGSNTSWQAGQMSSQGDANRNLPQGVYGVKVRTTSQGQDDDSEDDGDVSAKPYGVCVCVCVICIKPINCYL